VQPVLVTGAGGFIGARLALDLAAGSGADVRAVDLRPVPAAPGLRPATVDLRQTSALPSLVDGVDTVFHLASAHLQVRQSEAEYRDVNVRATAELVRVSVAAGVRRFVHTSTVGIYGHVAAPPAREDTEPAPGNAYERTKLEGERAVLEAAAGTGLELIILRPAWVYGPGCPRMAKLLRSVQRGRFFYIGRGSNLRHPIYIDDAIAAFRRAADAPASLSGRAYVIAGPRYITLRELVDTCARQLHVKPPRLRLPRALAVAAAGTAELAFGAAGREPPFSRRSLVFFENDNAFDTSAARRDLGFVAETGLDEGLARTIAEGSWRR
jgi:dihydroflavonol-4-reductase